MAEHIRSLLTKHTAPQLFALVLQGVLRKLPSMSHHYWLCLRHFVGAYCFFIAALLLIVND
jgi:hypothetical protein